MSGHASGTKNFSELAGNATCDTTVRTMVPRESPYPPVGFFNSRWSAASSPRVDPERKPECLSWNSLHFASIRLASFRSARLGARSDPGAGGPRPPPGPYNPCSPAATPSLKYLTRHSPLWRCSERREGAEGGGRRRPIGKLKRGSRTRGSTLGGPGARFMVLLKNSSGTQPAQTPRRLPKIPGNLATEKNAQAPGGACLS